MIVRQVTNRLHEGGLRRSAVRTSKFFGEVMEAKLKIIVQVIFHIDDNFNRFKEMKKYHFRDELQKRKLSLVLIGKTAMIVRNIITGGQFS